MKINVLHDEAGEIIAISKVPDLKAAGSKFHRASIQAGRGQRLVEIQLRDEHKRKSLVELHNEHFVDPLTATLIKKTAPSATETRANISRFAANAQTIEGIVKAVMKGGVTFGEGSGPGVFKLK
jgi:hypothetical protein